MLADWAVTRDTAGITVNWIGPLDVHTANAQGQPVHLRCETDYPVSGRVRWIVGLDAPKEFTLRFRIPAWSKTTKAQIGGGELAPVPGKYLEVKRRWEPGEAVELEFDMSTRAVAGEREAEGKVSLFRGPILLAWDQRFHGHDEASIPPVDLGKR